MLLSISDFIIICCCFSVAGAKLCALLSLHVGLARVVLAALLLLARILSATAQQGELLRVLSRVVVHAAHLQDLRVVSSLKTAINGLGLLLFAILIQTAHHDLLWLSVLDGQVVGTQLAVDHHRALVWCLLVQLGQLSRFDLRLVVDLLGGHAVG